MSIAAIRAVFDHSQAKGVQRMVLLAFAEHVNAEGDEAWPAVTTLARMCNCPRETASRAVKALLASGELADTGRLAGTKPILRLALTVTTDHALAGGERDERSRSASESVTRDHAPEIPTVTRDHADRDERSRGRDERSHKPERTGKEPEEERLSDDNLGVRARTQDLVTTFSQPPLLDPEDDPPSMVDDLVADWNRTARFVRERFAHCIAPAPVKALRPNRRVAIQRMLNDTGMTPDDWRDAFQTLARDKWGRGEPTVRRNGWATRAVTLDWFVTDNRAPQYGGNPPILHYLELDNAPTDAIQSAVSTGDISDREAAIRRALSRLDGPARDGAVVPADDGHGF